MPKTLTKLEIYTTSLFSLILSGTADLFLDAKFNLYHYFHEGIQLIDYIAMIGIYPAINIIFLNLYPQKKNYKIKIFYFIIRSLFATIYEYTAKETSFFSHHGWKIWYSALIYPILFFILLLNLKFVRKLK
ncbi:CBO0543 family protein [Niallia nealsonii]